jgi:hypothetical protein
MDVEQMANEQLVLIFAKAVHDKLTKMLPTTRTDLIFY